MIEELIQRIEAKYTESLKTRFQSLCEELDRLEPNDFEAAHRFKFVHIRRMLRQYAEVPEEHTPALERIFSCPPAMNVEKLRPALSRMEVLHLVAPFIDAQSQIAGASCLHIADQTKKRLNELSATLDAYLGPDNLGITRKLPFLRDTGLRALLERDYRDLTLRLFPIRTWKSVVVLAGSILEGLLHDLLTRDAPRIASAMAARSAPKRPRNYPPAGVRDLASIAYEDQWMLNEYIEVSDELGLLPAGWKAGVQAVLRDFRNYVHPRKELRAPDPITEGEAFQSVGALIRICDHIEKNHP